jgi:putative tryptophan/tyrosine transport system substrate-binding protein
MMDRRAFISNITLGLCAAPLAANAQPVQQVYRIGLLSSAPMRADAEFRQWTWVLALRDLGWIEGQNIVFERRASDGKADLLPGLARELVRANVRVIATFSSADTFAAKQATSVIPIVMIFSGLDPVEEGFIASFARPGGNITGVSRMLAETDAKRLELIKELLPPAGRIGVLARLRDDATEQARFERAMHAAARNLRIELQFFPYRSQDDVEAAFPAMVGLRVQAFLLEPSFQIFRNRGRIAELALKHGLPGVFTLREYAAAGGLMSYGPDYPNLERQHARYIDRILRGANPGDLPIEQPTKFELVINLKTAKALGITIPQLLLLRADEVIQ